MQQSPHDVRGLFRAVVVVICARLLRQLFQLVAVVIEEFDLFGGLFGIEYGDGVADPKGSVTIVNVDSLTSSVVGFDAFDSERESLAAEGVVLRKNTAPSVDLEPEYIAVDSGKAYVTLQEANAIAVLDIKAGTYDGVYSIGFEDYMKLLAIKRKPNRN